MTAPIILIDGSSYFFRAFHALPPLTNSKGQPTGAIYGVANMIKKLIKDYQPTHLAVVFDAKGKTFREDLYPEYKAHRPLMPSDLSSQFHPLMQLLECMGLPLLIIDGVEADDVIGTLAKQATEQGLPVLVSTSDKDMAQLVNDHVTLVNTMSNYTMDVAGVKAKFGVEPHQIIDYLTLIGDTSDNIPGVPKCGPKTAAKWLHDHQTLENLLTHADSISGKIGENLRSSIPHLPLSRTLVTIKTDVPLPLTLSDLTLKEVNQHHLLQLVQELEFKNWLKELLEPQEEAHTPEKPITAFTPEIIVDEQKLETWVKTLSQSSQFSLYAVPSSQDIMQAELVGIAVAMDCEHAAYIPLNHKEGAQLPTPRVLNALKPLFENKAIKKLGHYLKNDYIILRRYGIRLQGIAGDTTLESYVMNSAGGSHDIASLSLKYLGQSISNYEDLVGKGSKQLNFEHLNIAQAASFAATLAIKVLQLHQKLEPMLPTSVQEVLEQIELPLISVLAEMELTGVLIDAETLAKHGIRLKERIRTLEDEAITLAGRPFNLSSPKQLQEILFFEQKIPIISKTPKGQPSTAEAVLQELAYDYRLAAVILEHRSLTKLVSTYIDALPKKINKNTGRVHTSYNQAVTATGRLSSSEPNLQNIPIRNEEARLIRTAFIAPVENIILAADYSQIELRIMAHLSQDENLLLAFANGWDIHTATASEIFQTPRSEVSSEQRRRAKAINFGLIYGMSAFGLAKQIGVERHDAQNYIDTYFQRYPKVQQYMVRTREQAHQQGYVETLFGRRLYLPEINTRNIMRQKAAERAAINAPMQGTAADIIKKAMLAINNWLATQENPPFRMIMQVHDELVFEVQSSALAFCNQKIRELMEHAATLAVPLLVTVGSGSNWENAH
ncbi:MAG: DNA polymerase I [Legionella sp.]|nr:DNA polymerase I [Legionella sp.]